MHMLRHINFGLINVVCLSETKMIFEKIEKVRKKLNFEHGVYSEPFGRCGGLVVW